MSPAIRFPTAVLFIVGGCCLVFMSMLGGPSLWYFACFCALIPIGVLWLWRPSLAALLSIGPLVSVAALCQYLSGVWLGALAFVFLVAAVLVAAELREAKGWWLPLALSLAFLGASFGADRLFTNKNTIKTYQMYVAVDGNAPWGEVGPEWPDGSPPVVVYRRMGTGYCYDGFHSKELHDRLASVGGRMVNVEYNTFSDFGREHSYNVRSVDGLVLNQGQKVVRHFDSFGGHILGEGEAATSTDECH